MEIPANSSNFFLWIKNKDLKFSDATECFANLAGANSIKALCGKNDYELVWKKIADYARSIDWQILSKKIPYYINMIETIDVYERNLEGDLVIKKHDILINKSLLTNRSNKTIGVIGSLINVTDYSIIKKTGYTDSHGNFNLGENFRNTYLTKRELAVFKQILLGYPSKIIAKNLQVSYRTIEGHVNNIKNKLQCKTKGDIFYIAVTQGLHYIVFESQANLRKNFEKII